MADTHAQPGTEGRGFPITQFRNQTVVVEVHHLGKFVNTLEEFGIPT